MKRALRAAILAVLVSASLACVMPDQVTQIQKDMSAVREELRAASRQQSEIEQRLTAIESRPADEDQITRADLAELRVAVDRSVYEASTASERISELQQRIDRLAQQLAQVRQPPRTATQPPEEPFGSASPTDLEAAPTERPVLVPRDAPTAAGPEAVPDAESLYNTAYADFSKGNYALAIAGFEEYREKFPNSALADNAMYWVGECYYSQGDFPAAVQALDRLLEAYPDSDKGAAANLKKGLAYLEQNQIGQAIIQLRYVAATYPASDEAKVARDKLTSLGAPI